MQSVLVPSLTLAVVSVMGIILASLELVTGLQCWHCIGDDCDKDPGMVERAKPKPCRPGTSCMKVYYRVKSAKTNVILESTTRTCSAGQCIERNDFVNCTNDNVENPGCMRQYCCADRDMCNAAPPSWPVQGHMTVAMLVGASFYCISTGRFILGGG